MDSELKEAILDYQYLISKKRYDLDPLMSKTGKVIDMMNFSAKNVDFYDIAAGLSCTCRFAGQYGFYSVAEHSILVGDLGEARSGGDMDRTKSCFLHDACETYLNDLITPLKVLCPGYIIIEDHFQKIIKEAFDLKYDFDDPFVKSCDHDVYLLERVALGRDDRDSAATSRPGLEWNLGHVKKLLPKEAEEAFIARGKELGLI